jgi:hypothetical protein
MARTQQAAQANITLQEQIEAIHQALGLVDGLDLLLQGDIGLGGLLCTRHATRMTVPSDLRMG